MTVGLVDALDALVDPLCQLQCKFEVRRELPVEETLGARCTGGPFSAACKASRNYIFFGSCFEREENTMHPAVQRATPKPLGTVFESDCGSTLRYDAVVSQRPPSTGGTSICKHFRGESRLHTVPIPSCLGLLHRRALINFVLSISNTKQTVLKLICFYVTHF